ncbi:MAG: Tar ligand binding domain-containing protein [Rhodocyclaceae bacterium]|nr:Tar ligand binding domain-containing protein [Rhodocyclaceae bacterium]
MVAGGILGITGLNLSNSAIQSLHDEEMSPVQTIGRINFLMADNRAQMVLALHHNPLTHPDARHDHPLAAHLQTMDRNKNEIDRLWDTYARGIRSEAEKALADRYWEARNRYVQEGLLEARRAFESGDYPQAETVLLDRVTPLYDTANADVSVLLKHLSQRGHERFTAVAERNRTIAEIAVAGIALGTLALVFAGIFFFRATVMPLQKAVLALEDIAEGNLSGHVDEDGYGEPGRVMAAVTVMQMHLKVMMHEIRQSSDSIYRQCANLNRTMMNLAEHSDEQHDRIYQAIDAIGESCAGLRAMAANAEALMQSAVGDGQPDIADIATNEPQGSGLEPISAELLAVFGDTPDMPPPAMEDRRTETAAAAEPDQPPADEGPLPQQIRELAGAARLQTFAVDDVAAQLNQVASLIVQNREEVQGAWAASQQLEKTADELEKLVKYFE